jgi:hypothetical protein
MAERKGRQVFVLFFNDVLVMISDGLVVIADSAVRWKWRFTFRESQIGIVTS